MFVSITSDSHSDSTFSYNSEYNKKDHNTIRNERNIWSLGHFMEE